MEGVIRMKQNLAVIFGGESSEYEVSLRSATFIIENIDCEKYNVVKIGITKTGQWLMYSGNSSHIASGEWINDPNNVTAFLSPDKKIGGLVVFYPDRTDVIKLDVIFPVLHGKNGEDGTIQGLFKLSGVPYVGCDCLSSAVCMDKAVTHSLLNTANIEQAHYMWFYFDRYQVDAQRVRDRIIARLNYPMFVKPANSGSTIGISKVNNSAELHVAIMKAAKEDLKIVVEEGVIGREIECAVYGGRDAVASPLGEIIPGAEFYDYDDKYVNNKSQNLIPANLSEELATKVRETAVRAYKYLGCEGLARVDFFVCDDGKIILNEINTLPGFTSISMYPKLWLSTGISSGYLVQNLIDTAFRRYK